MAPAAITEPISNLTKNLSYNFAAMSGTVATNLMESKSNDMNGILKFLSTLQCQHPEVQSKFLKLLSDFDQGLIGSEAVIVSVKKLLSNSHALCQEFLNFVSAEGTNKWSTTILQKPNKLLNSLSSDCFTEQKQTEKEQCSFSCSKEGSDKADESIDSLNTIHHQASAANAKSDKLTHDSVIVDQQPDFDHQSSSSLDVFKQSLCQMYKKDSKFSLLEPMIPSNSILDDLYFNSLKLDCSVFS